MTRLRKESSYAPSKSTSEALTRVCELKSYFTRLETARQDDFLHLSSMETFLVPCYVSMTRYVCWSVHRSVCWSVSVNFFLPFYLVSSHLNSFYILHFDFFLLVLTTINDLRVRGVSLVIETIVFAPPIYHHKFFSHLRMTE